MSENRRIAKAAGLVGALTLCSRVAGLARDVVVGYFFGTGFAADAFFVAFRIPNLLRRFVGEGAMGMAFVPVFTEYLARRDRSEVAEAFRALVGAMTLLLVALVFAGSLLAPKWVPLLAPGFLSEPGKLLLTVRLTQILFAYVLLVSLVALFGGLLHALRHFAAPAASPILLNLCVIVAALVLAPQLETPVYALAYGVLAGGVLQFLLQLIPLVKRGFSVVPLWRPQHEAVRRVARLMAPALLGGTVYQLNVMMGTVFASTLPAGSVSYLWYSDRVFEFPLGIVAVALGTAALPSFAAQAARGAYAELRSSLGFAVRLTSFLTLPAAVGIGVLALPVATVLFQRGAFGAHEAEMTAWALRMFAVGLWSVSIVRLLVPAFYAVGDTRTPVIAAGIGFLANAVFSLMFMGAVNADGTSALMAVIANATRLLGVCDLRHAGLALATSVAATVNFLVLAVVLSRRLGGMELGLLIPSLVRSLAAAVLMALPVWLTSRSIDWSGDEPFHVQALVLFLAIGVGLGTFGALAHAFGCPEAAAVRKLIRDRLGRGRLPDQG